MKLSSCICQRENTQSHKEKAEKIGVLNTEIQKGIVSGDGGILDIQKIKVAAKSKVNVNP